MSIIQLSIKTVHFSPLFLQVSPLFIMPAALMFSKREHLKISFLFMALAGAILCLQESFPSSCGCLALILEVLLNSNFFQDLAKSSRFPASLHYRSLMLLSVFCSFAHDLYLFICLHLSVFHIRSKFHEGRDYVCLIECCVTSPSNNDILSEEIMEK